VNFEESTQYLYNLGNEVLAMKLGLENIRKLLAALGNPEKNFVKIQVAGTNGKGSTCAFLEAICVSAKIKTGLFTSPHLISITERIKINGEEISETDFARHATKIKEISENLLQKGELETLPTFFEQITAIAFSAFAEAKIELAILETGLGGRFDATTAANAEIVAITPIDFDHQDVLGNTLLKIAAEKAAIIREDTKVVLAKQEKEIESFLFEICSNFGVKPKTSELKAEIIKSEKNGRLIVDFQTKKAKYENVSLSLLGKHQIENAKVAINLAETLREDNFKITDENVVNGLETAIHKGRLEFYEGILFDGAHNVAGAKALREYLDEFGGKPFTIVFGAMRDKDLQEIADVLFPKAENLILTVPENPRSMTTADLLKFLPKDFEKDNVFTTDTVAEAIEKAKRLASDNQLIVITGSLYLIGEAQKIINKKS
jgi:dihydrofolate synthase/folylpolyglutamate synthase